MVRHLRIFFLFCSPLLLGAMVFHTALEQADDTEIEHNRRIDGEADRASSKTPTSPAPEVGSLVRPDLQTASSHIVWCECLGCPAGGAGTPDDRKVQSACTLQTIRLLI